MQELIAELIAAMKASRAAQVVSSEAHRKAEAAHHDSQAAHERVRTLRFQLMAEIRAGAGYSPEDIARIAEHEF